MSAALSVFYSSPANNMVAMVFERPVSTKLGMETGLGVFSLGSELKALAAP